MQPGLYDSKNNLIKTWNELEKAGLDISFDYTDYNGEYEDNRKDPFNFFYEICADSDSPFDEYVDTFKLVISDEIAKIGDYAFYKCNMFNEIVLPETIKTIGKGAFLYCDILSKINIPESLKIIEEETFCECVLLKDIVLPAGIIEIGSGAFANCRSIASFVVPEKVTTLNESLFAGCWSLTDVTLHNDILYIKDGAFCGCKALSIINLPNNLLAIDDNAFNACDSLVSIKIPKSVQNIGRNVFLCRTNALKELYISKNTLKLNPHIEEDYKKTIIIYDNNIEDLINEGKSFKDINTLNLRGQNKDATRII